MAVIDVLKGARALIARGWCQKKYREDVPFSFDVHYCSAGAIHEAGKGGLEMRDMAAMLFFNRIFFGHNVFSEEAIVNWNDAAGRTQAEVLGAFDLVIGKLQAGEFIASLAPAPALIECAPHVLMEFSHETPSCTVFKPVVVAAPMFHAKQSWTEVALH